MSHPRNERRNNHTFTENMYTSGKQSVYSGRNRSIGGGNKNVDK